jgi:hydrogenase maturation protease
VSSHWTVLACGDSARGDDAVAIAAIDRLAPEAVGDACVRHIGQLLPDDLVLALADGPCILVDAVHGIEPGAVVELPLRRVAASEGPVPASSHALPLEVVVGLADALGADIDNGVFIGIGGRSFRLGGRLSFSAWCGAREAARAISRRIAPAEHRPIREAARCV